MNPEIFREYDIRGIAGKDMTETDVLMIGKAVGTYLIQHGRLKLTVGRDCRITSDRYAEKIIEGLLSTGCDVVDVGVCPTPVFYFSIKHLDKQGGVMITASHNPPEYNGFKLCMGMDSIHGEDIQKISRIIDTRSFDEGKGNLSHGNVVPSYQKFVKKNIKLNKPLRVGIDSGNGTVGVVAVPIMKKIGCTVYDIFCDINGTFPNHHADPSNKNNLQDLIGLVKKKKLDLGLAYDVDGDRLGVIDENGGIIYGDKLLLIFSKEILARKPNATFISEVASSKIVYDYIKELGGRAIMWKTGNAYIKEKMTKERAELAGEMNGALYFADRYFGYEDAIYASCRLLEIISNTGKKLSELLADVPKTYSTPEIRVKCPDEKKFAVEKKIIDFFRKRFDVIDIDGVRINFHDGWGLVRASNTQPAIVLRYEAMTKPRLNEIQNLIESTLFEIQNK